MKNDNYLSKETTTNLKGIFALIIFFGHLKNSTPLLVGTTIGNLISIWAYLVVGGFFFFSGYGLCLQHKKHGKDYIKKFPFRRILPLYISCLVFSLIQFIYDLTLGNLNFSTFIKAILIPGRGIVFGWYIEATFIIYILFWLFFSLFPKINRVLAFSIISALYLFITAFFNSPVWINSFGGFILGFLWCEYKDKIDALMSKNAAHILSTILCTVTFAITFYFGNLNSIEDTLMAKIMLFVSVIAFIATILLFLNC